MKNKFAYYARRLMIEVQARLTPEISVSVGEKRLKLPGWSRDAVRLAYRWGPAWKAAVIKEYYKPSQGIFVDVGSNIGETLLDYVSAFGDCGRYVGFEPNLDAAKIAREIISLNSLGNATLINAGLSEETALFFLHFSDESSVDTSASIIPEVRPTSTAARQPVVCLRFSDAQRLFPGDKLSMIKIDVEGAELSVLRGMKEKIEADRPVILCEVLHRDPEADVEIYRGHVEGLNNLLHEMNYAIYNVVPQRQPSYTKIDRLVVQTWGADSHDACDYLFVPI